MVVRRRAALAGALCFCAVAGIPAADEGAFGSFRGIVRNGAGRPIDRVDVQLERHASGTPLTQVTGAEGRFAFLNVPPGRYSLSVRWRGRTTAPSLAVELKPGETMEARVRVSDDFQLVLEPGPERAAAPPAAAISSYPAGRSPACRSTNATSASYSCFPPRHEPTPTAR